MKDIDWDYIQNFAHQLTDELFKRVPWLEEKRGRYWDKIQEIHVEEMESAYSDWTKAADFDKFFRKYMKDKYQNDDNFLYQHGIEECED